MMREAIIVRMQSIGMSQNALAKLCRGRPSQGSICTFIQGKSRMNDDNLSRVIAALGGYLVFPSEIREVKDGR